MGKILTILIIFTTGASIMLTGCSTSGCIENQSSIPLAGFYSKSLDKEISIDSISIGGVGATNDSLIIDNGQSISQVYLPLRSSVKKTAFYIHYEQKALDYDELNDTITFEYNSIPYFVSEECGAMYYYAIHNMTYTRHIVDSAALLDSMITNTDIERIKIYFRTSDSEE